MLARDGGAPGRPGLPGHPAPTRQGPAAPGPEAAARSGGEAAPALELRGLGLRAPDGRRLVDRLDLRLPAGELLAVLGGNGAGKSTLLRHLASEPLGPGFQAQGEAWLAGRRLGAWTPRERAQRRAVLPQHTDLPSGHRALDVVALGRQPHGEGAREAESLAWAALEEAGVARLAGRPMQALSGGERARVYLAAALVQLRDPGPAGPKLLLLDEPTAALDLAQQHRLLDGLRRLGPPRGLGMVVVLHDLNLAAQHADRVLLLEAGGRARLGLPGAVLEAATVARVYGVRAARQAHPLTAGAPLLATASLPAPGDG